MREKLFRSIVEGVNVTAPPLCECRGHGDAVAVALGPVRVTMLGSGVAHPAGADFDAGVLQRPATFRHVVLPHRICRRLGQIAHRMRMSVVLAGGEFAASQADP